MVLFGLIVIGLLKKKFFGHGYRKYEFPYTQGQNQICRCLKLSSPVSLGRVN